jgi:hyperosmotically inducible protein
MGMGRLADQIVLNRIRDRICWDKRISAADVRPTISHGEVTLTGTVDSQMKRDAAYEIAITTAGIGQVDNQIVVSKLDFREDGEIRSILNAQLRTIGLQPGEYVSVDVVDGVVKLEGFVFRSTAKARAVSVAWELSGVRDCLNLIEIRDPFRSKDESIELATRVVWS